MMGPGEREATSPLGFGAGMPAIVRDIDGRDTEGRKFEDSVGDLRERKPWKETKGGRIATLNN
jgi:hypothetical protein